jgi:nitric oxide reductase large subunit
MTGEVVFSKNDVLDGMDVFRRYGLMEYGSIYGMVLISAPISRQITCIELLLF